MRSEFKPSHVWHPRPGLVPAAPRVQSPSLCSSVWRLQGPGKQELDLKCQFCLFGAHFLDEKRPYVCTFLSICLEVSKVYQLKGNEISKQRIRRKKVYSLVFLEWTSLFPAGLLSSVLSATHTPVAQGWWINSFRESPPNGLQCTLSQNYLGSPAFKMQILGTTSYLLNWTLGWVLEKYSKVIT